MRSLKRLIDAEVVELIMHPVVFFDSRGVPALGQYLTLIPGTDEVLIGTGMAQQVRRPKNKVWLARQIKQPVRDFLGNPLHKLNVVYYSHEGEVSKWVVKEIGDELVHIVSDKNRIGVRVLGSHVLKRDH